MRFLFSPNGAFLYDRLLELLIYQNRPNTLIVEALLSELVKEMMRDKAIFPAASHGDPLQESVTALYESIEAELERMRIIAELNPYFETVKAKLKYGAREVADLSKAGLRKDFKESPEARKSIRGVPYQITALSIGNQFNGILGFAIDGSTFSLVELQEQYTVKENWFPLVATTEEFMFVVDYSSALVNLKGITSDQWVRAKDELAKMMDTLSPT